MQFENTEEKKLLVMVLISFLANIKNSIEYLEDDTSVDFCNKAMKLYEENESKLKEIIGDSSNLVVSNFAMQTLKNLLQEF